MRPVVVLWIGFLLIAAVPKVEAIPAFARKYKVNCTLCHTAWPKLNKFGRDFKIHGFRTPQEMEALEKTNLTVGDYLTIDQAFPISARFVMRPFDKQKDKRAKIRSFHEVELFVAGRVGKNVSAWLEAEAEDEVGFNLGVESGVMGYHPAEQANVTAGWGAPFWSDPFATLADGGRRMTRGHKVPLDLSFTGRERLRSASQFITFYGQGVNHRVFYMAGVSSGGGDPEGGDARDWLGRLMVEAIPGLNVGAFVLAGTNETQAADTDFRRAGFDFQLERGNLNVYGVVMNAHDDFLTDRDGSIVVGGRKGETVGYVEGLYTFQLETIPMIVPLARIDWQDDFKDLTFVLNFYLRDNLKAYGEWWQNIDTPAGVSNKNRFTVQIDFGF